MVYPTPKLTGRKRQLLYRKKKSNNIVKSIKSLSLLNVLILWTFLWLCVILNRTKMQNLKTPLFLNTIISENTFHSSISFPHGLLRRTTVNITVPVKFEKQMMPDPILSSVLHLGPPYIPTFK